MLWIFQIRDGGHFEIVILRVMAALGIDGAKPDRFSVKFSPRNIHKNEWTHLASIEFPGLLHYMTRSQRRVTFVVHDSEKILTRAILMIGT